MLFSSSNYSSFLSLPLVNQNVTVHYRYVYTHASAYDGMHWNRKCNLFIDCNGFSLYNNSRFWLVQFYECFFMAIMKISFKIFHIEMKFSKRYCHINCIFKQMLKIIETIWKSNSESEIRCCQCNQLLAALQLHIIFDCNSIINFWPHIIQIKCHVWLRHA